MNKQEIEHKFQIIMDKIEQIFAGRGKYYVESRQQGLHDREQYVQKHNVKNPNDFNFSLTAEDIINNPEVSKMIAGCCGIAKLFAHFAKEIGLKDVKILATAKYGDFQRAKNNYNFVMKNKTPIRMKDVHMDGHQIITMRLPDGDQITFDPTIGIFIDGTIMAGNIIKSNGGSNDDYIISGIIDPEEFEKTANTYQGLMNIYASGSHNDSNFRIKPNKNFKIGKDKLKKSIGDKIIKKLSFGRKM